MEEMADYTSAMGYFERGRWTNVQFTCALGPRQMMRCRAEIFLLSFHGDSPNGTCEIFLLLQWSAN